MIFEKNSTRTRVSFETGMFQLGGHALFLSGKESQIGRGEPIEDTARVLSRYCDGIMIRTFGQEEVEKLVKEAYPDADLSGDPAGWLSGMTLTASGRVGTMKVGGVELSGGAVRTLFSLRSACFQVTCQEGKFTFSVTGYGHGVGMSQYGANAMAAQGSSWEDILKHYYTGVTIEAKS